MKDNLAEAFVSDFKAVKHGPPCWTCSLPPDQLKAVHEARKAGVSIPSIVQSLVTRCGYPLGKAQRVKNHFENRHHVQSR